MQKYIMTDETKEIYGLTLHRIKALESFADVKSGDLGGWIEAEKNLSQDGDAWVYGNAMVSRKGDILTVSNIGSRNDCTTFFRCVDNAIRVSCGCFKGDLEAFRAKVVKTHGGNIHAKNYLLAAKLAEQAILGAQEDNNEEANP